MTKTESRSAVNLDELASWDDADEGDQQYPLSEAGIRELVVYNFDSDKQTLVGLGPLERARRSRMTAEIPDSQRMPQSEAPGPFVADDDDEVPPSFRKPMVAWWAVVGPALIAGLAVLALRGAAPDDAHSAKITKAAAPALPVAPAVLPAISPENEPAPAVAAAELEQLPSVATESPPAPPVDVTAQVAKPSAIIPPAVPVKLAEVPPPSVVVLSNGTAAKVGTVNVTSNPPANVVLDGRPIGMAPRLVQVPAGLHKLVFIHPLYGRQAVHVTVNPGQTATAAATF
jgi:PEGA domain